VLEAIAINCATHTLPRQMVLYSMDWDWRQISLNKCQHALNMQICVTVTLGNVWNVEFLCKFSLQILLPNGCM
jgi:hypothetical protein